MLKHINLNDIPKYTGGPKTFPVTVFSRKGRVFMVRTDNTKAMEVL